MRVFPFLKYQAGQGTASYRPSGVILVNTTTQATVGTSEETLATVTIPANTLSANGQALRFSAFFSTAANGNTKIVRVRWNATNGNIITAASTATSAGPIIVMGYVVRTGAATQLLAGPGWGQAGTANNAFVADTVALTGDVVVYVRGVTASAIADMTFQALIVEYLP